MLNFLTIIKVIVQLLPVLITTIMTLEQVMPEGGKGKEKLEALKAIVEAAYRGSSDALPPFEDLWATINRTVTAIVALLNTIR